MTGRGAVRRCVAALLLLGAPVVTAAEAGRSFRDCPECPELVALPGGRFVMGAAPGEEARENLSEEFRRRSEPQHAVAVQAFAAGRFEVTRGEFRAFAEATGHTGDGCFVWGTGAFELHPDKNWRNPGFAQTDQHPATCVSWDDASAYVRWLGARTGKPYRLLSEAEWEYAARAGTAAARFWGNDPLGSCDHANGADRAAEAQVPDARNWGAVPCDDGHAWTAPVGRFRPNAWGLHDVLGNVAEWTADCWNPSYVGAPNDGRARTDGDCAMRAVRGGAWNENPLGLRAAYRVGSPTSVRVHSRGFRVARDL